MEPWLFSHGNYYIIIIIIIKDWLLQWSHDFSVMETIGYWMTVISYIISFNGAMTFQSWKPKRFSHCRSIFKLCFNGAMTFQSWKQNKRKGGLSMRILLQWSHDFSVMETLVSNSEYSYTIMLQWSHDFSVMETALNTLNKFKIM